MATRDTETLTQLVATAAGTRGSGLTYDQLVERSVDEETGYRPSRNLLQRIGTGQAVKMNPPLVRAVAAGLGLPLGRVEAAAHRQFIGTYVAVDPGVGGGGDDDEVIRVARRGGVTPRDTGGVEEFVRRSRDDDASDEG